MSFWTDPKIADDFTPEDRYLYLYLITNPHTNLCGCYEISLKQISDETGYTKDRIEKLLERLERDHRTIVFSPETREVLLVNWHKYNWTTSEKLRVPLYKEIKSVKNVDFKAFLENIYNGIDTVSIPYRYGSDTTVSVSVSDNISNSVNKKKKVYGVYKHIRLTETEYETLISEYGEYETLYAIRYLDEYIEMKGIKYKSHYLAMRKWVYEAAEKERKKHGDRRVETKQDEEQRNAELDEHIRRVEAGEYDAEDEELHRLFDSIKVSDMP